MRILIAHSRYLSGSASGENRVVEDEARLLREAGHHVTTWTPSFPADTTGTGLLRAGIRTVWSGEAFEGIRRLLGTKSVDVVHVHNLFPALSPSVIKAAVAEGVRVVATLHNYRLMCLPATLLRDGRPCEDCVGRVPWPGVVHRCYRSSSAASAAIATSLVVHRRLGTFRSVALYLAVSEFVRRKHIEGGFPPSQIRVRPNFAWPAKRRQGPGRYFLYIGRLSSEKGLPILLQAWQRSTSPLLIAGDGPERTRLDRQTEGNVRLLGPVPPSRAEELLVDARALVLPSLSYEGAPRSIVEAYASGVPVIASRMGGLPESVEDGGSGLLVPPGDPEALRQAAGQLESDERSLQLGDGAFRLWSERYGPQPALASLEKAYSDVLGDEGV